MARARRPVFPAVLTAAQILDNRRPQVLFGFTEGFHKAGREDDNKQPTLLLT